MNGRPYRHSDDGDAVALGHEDPATGEQRHRQRLDESTHTVPCSECGGSPHKQHCGTCHGTGLLPATAEEYESQLYWEIAQDVRDFGLDRIQKLPNAIHIAAHLYQIICELESRSNLIRRPA